MALQVEATTAESTGKDDDSISTDDFQETTTFSDRGCCSFWNFPCNPSRNSDNWERISTSESEQQESGGGGGGGGSWWGEGVKTLKKVREWSEIVAGPKWKTFIRRFNKTAGSRPKPGKFQYDPMSYALNFDDGPGQNGQVDDDRLIRAFSTRYAAIPVQNGQLKEPPSFT